jgi:hypothetical protein
MENFLSMEMDVNEEERRPCDVDVKVIESHEATRYKVQSKQNGP